MSETTLIQLTLVICITVVICTGLIALVIDGKQRRDAIERVHQRSLEAAQQMQWQVEQPTTPTGDDDE